MTWIVGAGVVLVIAIAIYDLIQRQRAILRTFPIIGHFRYWLEALGPELRQYIVSFQPRSAALDLRIGQAREQLLRVWLGQ